MCRTLQLRLKQSIPGSVMWGRGGVVCGRDKGITDGGGCSGWFGAWNSCRRCISGFGAVVGVAVGTGQSCKEGRGDGGLQLLGMTMSSSMSLLSSVRIWKGLLCCVRYWCTKGNRQIMRGVVMIVVASFEGVANATLGGGSISTFGDVGKGGGKLSWPDIIVESWQFAGRCLSLALAIVGTVRLSCLKRLAAASKVSSCLDATGAWQWAGCSCHVSTKQKHQVDGM
jgi:hypothetical protein